MKTSGLAVLLSIAAATACADVGEDDPDLATSNADLLTFGITWFGAQWDSRETTSLSGWQSVDCLDQPHDPQSAYLVTRLRAWRERASNLDNFVAKLSVRCSQFEELQDDLSRPGVDHTEVLYAGAYRDELGDSELYWDVVPIGLELALNSSGNHVKDVRLIYGELMHAWIGPYPSTNAYVDGYVDRERADWALDYASYGNTRELMCPDQTVMHEIRVKYDTRNGKIRRVETSCIAITDV